MSAVIEKQFYSRRELAEILGVCRRTVDSIRTAGHIEAVRIGGQIRFHREAVERFIESRKIPSKSAS